MRYFFKSSQYIFSLLRYGIKTQNWETFKNPTRYFPGKYFHVVGWGWCGVGWDGGNSWKVSMFPLEASPGATICNTSNIYTYVTCNQFICAIVGYNMNRLIAHQSIDTMENDPF